ncbi:putative leader peptide [Saccharopolyspora sp. NPDC050389]|uniref:putative leader peptide n=1 Tax=Saccharopolyspora sp. NPDC050389 TaxID=3155516 RepID=UPI003403C334
MKRTRDHVCPNRTNTPCCVGFSPRFRVPVRVVGRSVPSLTSGVGPLDDCPVMITFTRRRHVDLRRVASQACRR